jgi:tRNA pseudouridine55 synthase
MAKDEDERAKRLAAALRDNLKRRKAQARELLPGTGRGTATRSGAGEGGLEQAESPLHHASLGPPPRSGED